MQKKFWWTALMAPLVIAPIAIVASCGSGTSSNNDANGGSNDKPNNDANGGSDNTTPVFSIKTDVTLIGLYPSESNPEQYNDPEKLMTLLFDYKKQIFNNPAYGLVYKFQIRLGQIKINIPDGSISFKVKIISPDDPNTDLIPVTDVTLRGFSKIPFQSIVFKSNTPSLSLSDSEKDPFQYMENKAKLIRLIVEKKNEIFEKFPSDLWDDQIEIVGDPEIFINSSDTTYLFCQIKIKNNFDANAPILLEPTKIGLDGFENKFSRNGVSADLKTLTTEQRDAAQYVDDKAKLIKLIAEKKNEIFGNWSNNLISNEKQIEIGGDVEVDFESGSLSVPIKVDFAGILIPENNLLDTGLHLKGFGTFRIKGQPTLTTEEREITQYVDDKAKLVKLIVAKQDQIFETDYYNNLTEKQIEIGGDVEVDFDSLEGSSLSFIIKIKVSSDSDTPVLLDRTNIKLYGFAKFRLQRSVDLSSSLTKEEKEITQYFRDKTKLVKLIVAKQDQIFETDYYNNLTEKQIEIVGNSASIIGDSPFFSNLKIKVKINSNASFFFEGTIFKLEGFGNGFLGTNIGITGGQRKIILSSLTTEQKEITQYSGNEEKLIQLLIEKKDQIFKYPPAILEKDQIEIADIDVDVYRGILKFWITKVKVSSDSDAPVLLDKIWIELYGFAAFKIKDSGSIILSSLSKEETELTQYVDNKAKLVKLIVAKQDQIFETDYYNNLTEKQIEILGDIEANPKAGTLKFEIKVKARPDSNDSVLVDDYPITLSGFQKK